jgi:hypothetical protein
LECFICTESLAGLDPSNRIKICATPTCPYRIHPVCFNRGNGSIMRCGCGLKQGQATAPRRPVQYQQPLPHVMHPQPIRHRERLSPRTADDCCSFPSLFCYWPLKIFFLVFMGQFLILFERTVVTQLHSHKGWEQFGNAVPFICAMIFGGSIFVFLLLTACCFTKDLHRCCQT